MFSIDEGIEYQLAGALYAPSGAGPFPVVLVNHGQGAVVGTTWRARASSTLRDFGMVAIAATYTHADGAPAGLLPDGPGDDFGASAANIARGRKTAQLAGCLPYADMSRLVVHGHSMGAFATAALVGS